ncbi:hypothetical protein [Pararhizobium sp.]|uniref:hypothetical protein n=1 Tax=Pararhizobium sp. TaxID=1977563 RepID=UPI0027173191|nr:hypothetical protein [Pararhizobium sp.]MDO9417962.1 hypothetical protein [Pararhizobium sp.]
MTAPHALDLTRLDVLKALRTETMSASTRISDEILDLHRQRSVAEGAMRLAEEHGRNNMILPEEMRRRISLLEKQQEEIVAKITGLQAGMEDAREKNVATSQLYASCAEFLGVDPNGN